MRSVFRQRLLQGQKVGLVSAGASLEKRCSADLSAASVMDTNQRDDSPAAPGGPDAERKAAASPGSPQDLPGADGHAKAAGFPPWPEAPVASGLRQAKVRAALFHKPEPIRVGRVVLAQPLGAGAM